MNYKAKPSMKTTQLKDFNETDTYPIAIMILELLSAIQHEDKTWELVENLLDSDPALVENLAFTIHSNFINREVSKQGGHYAN
jgi:hypothetical protein